MHERAKIRLLPQRRTSLVRHKSQQCAGQRGRPRSGSGPNSDQCELRPAEFLLLRAPFWEPSCSGGTGGPSNRRWSRYGGLAPLNQRCASTFVPSTWDRLPLPGSRFFPGSERCLALDDAPANLWDAVIERETCGPPLPELSGNTCQRSPELLLQQRRPSDAPAGQTIGLLSFDSRR